MFGGIDAGTRRETATTKFDTPSEESKTESKRLNCEKNTLEALLGRKVDKMWKKRKFCLDEKCEICGVV